MSVTDTELALFNACRQLVRQDRDVAVAFADYLIASYRHSTIQEAESWKLVLADYIHQGVESEAANDKAQRRFAQEEAA